VKTTETRKVYEKSCATKRLKFQQEEFEVWHRSLKDLELRDVEATLDAWWISPAVDSNGDLKSRWLPAPAELRMMALEISHKRVAQAKVKTFLVGWKCPACAHTVMTFLPAGDSAIRACKCGAEMQIMCDERPRAYA
jgi:hypothetical protein